MRAFLSIVILIPLLSSGQLGGAASYQALNLTSNPRAAALGGSTISLADGDISQVFENAAILDSVRSKSIFFHINPYFADVNVYSIAYTFDIGKMKGFSAGLQYVNFGSFEMRDETGSALGTFQANDYVFSLGKAHRVGPFTLGTSVKFAHSMIDVYRSSAVLVDVGGTFRVNKNWTIAMVFENMGGRLTNYTEFAPAPIPFDVKIGTTFKPQYMPLRFTITTTNLVEENETLEENTGGRSNSAMDNALKRINIGAELLLSKNVQFLIGYNHKRKQELRLTEVGGGAGLSFGLMIKIRAIELRYSRATYHAAGGSSFISVQTNLSDFKKIL